MKNFFISAKISFTFGSGSSPISSLLSSETLNSSSFCPERFIYPLCDFDPPSFAVPVVGLMVSPEFFDYGYAVILKEEIRSDFVFKETVQIWIEEENVRERENFQKMLPVFCR